MSDTNCKEPIEPDFLQIDTAYSATTDTQRNTRKRNPPILMGLCPASPLTMIGY